MDAVEKGGVAVMELIARELKAMGLYVARSLSFEGVEYEPLRHPLTPENIEVWNEWADAFQMIHANLDAALEAVGVKDEGGEAKSGQAVSQAALAIRDSLVAKMACLSAVPSVLDMLLERLGPDLVAEITGRSRRVVARNGRRVVERRSASAAKAETDSFMDGRKRVLVFSDAGGTGRSYHADLGVRNRERRVHYLVEPGWRADAAIQGLGRTHRTNQASAPLFRPVTTDIHGEKRFLSTIARRLDSLGALTRRRRRPAGRLGGGGAERRRHGRGDPAGDL